MIRAETKESQKAAPAIDPGSVAGSFLAGRTFKKRLVGGVDEVDLLGALEEMAALYEARPTSVPAARLGALPRPHSA